VSKLRGNPSDAARSRLAGSKLIELAAALENLETLNEELRHAELFKEDNFHGGLIAFRRRKKTDPKQINHADRDVVCHVIKGSGRLRINGRRTSLRPGVICHIAKGTPHDFAAGTRGELVLFYLLIKTG